MASMKLMRVVCWTMERGEEMKRKVRVRHTQEDDGRARKRDEVHLSVVVENDCQICQERCCHQ